MLKTDILHDFLVLFVNARNITYNEALETNKRKKCESFMSLLLSLIGVVLIRKLFDDWLLCCKVINKRLLNFDQLIRTSEMNLFSKF